MNHVADLIFEAHGSIVLVHPVSDEGRGWLEEHCPEDDDHIYVEDALGRVDNRLATTRQSG